MKPNINFQNLIFKVNLNRYLNKFWQNVEFHNITITFLLKLSHLLPPKKETYFLFLHDDQKTEWEWKLSRVCQIHEEDQLDLSSFAGAKSRILSEVCVGMLNWKTMSKYQLPYVAEKQMRLLLRDCCRFFFLFFFDVERAKQEASYIFKFMNGVSLVLCSTESIFSRFIRDRICCYYNWK